MRLQTCVLLIAATVTATMLAAAPGMAQSSQPKVRSNPIDPITGYPIPANRKEPRARTSVTVTKRTYLDPGKESKAPGLTWSSFPADSPQGLFYDPTANYLHFNNRNPFPNCLDLPGFCR
jgi:Flp pilus assembly protein CpaB